MKFQVFKHQSCLSEKTMNLSEMLKNDYLEIQDETKYFKSVKGIN